MAENQSATYQELKERYGKRAVKKYCQGISASQLKTICEYTFGDLYERLYYDYDNHNFIVVVNSELDEIINGAKTGENVYLDRDNLTYFELYWKPTKVVVIKREN
jgi:hypothetical protein